jgi:hypothetical protein
MVHAAVGEYYAGAGASVRVAGDFVAGQQLYAGVPAGAHE